jgi:hypothetical protein
VTKPRSSDRRSFLDCRRRSMRHTIRSRGSHVRPE